ncbi:MAG: restriction endonuclease subunit S [Acetomicrobium sp.]
MVGDEKLRKPPEEWEECKLIDIIELRYGKGLIGQDRKNGNIPVYGSNGIIGYHNKYLVKGPGIIIGRKGSVGEIKYSPLDFFPIDTTYYVSPKKEIDIKYMYYFLLTLRLDEMNSHSAVPGLNRSSVHSINIAIPPLTEQRKIAEILETADKAIEKTDAIIEKYRRIKQGLMQDLLTKGIDEKGQIRSEETHKFKDSPLGRLPEEWEVAKLGTIGEITSSKRVYFKEYVEEGIPFYRSKEIIEKAQNLDVKKVLFIPEDKYKQIELKYGVPKKGDVLITAVGTLGIIYIIKEEDCKFYFKDGNLLWIKDPDESMIDVEFLFHAFEPVFTKQRDVMIIGTSQNALTIEKMKCLQLPLPPLPEQHRIASVLSQIDEVIEKEEQYKVKLERIKQGLMPDLLTGEVRVNHLIKET